MHEQQQDHSDADCDSESNTDSDDTQHYSDWYSDLTDYSSGCARTRTYGSPSEDSDSDFSDFDSYVIN